jgi:hypothetical protein
MNSDKMELIELIEIQLVGKRSVCDCLKVEEQDFEILQKSLKC